MDMAKRPDSGAKIPEQVLDELLKGVVKPEDLLGPDGLLKALKKALVERVLSAELTHHLGYGRGEDKPDGQDNHRNGTTPKTLITEDGELPLEVPRDRAGTFEPQLVPKGVRRLEGFDEKVLSLYARGMTVREIQGHLAELYGVEVSPDLISTVTDAVLEEVKEWQNRPLEALYPVVIFDALRIKIRDEGVVRNKAVYLALGITRSGTKEVLGIWVEQTEGAKFWLKVMTELKNRGVADILICLIDGLKGFPEAIAAVFPQTTVQTCIVHLLRHSLDFATWKDRKHVAAELKTVYRAPTAEAAGQALEAFAAGPWGKKYPAIAASWRRNWERVIPFFAFPLLVRKVLYTTNAIESLHMQLRKIVKNRGHFPSDEAAIKLLYLALTKIEQKWRSGPAVEWKSALAQFAILFEDRFAAVGG
jgi:transposase-like protein